MIKAAIALFARQGYLRTTLAEVGSEAGYTAGLVSHKFGSKQGLLAAVVERITTRFLNDQLGASIERDSALESLNNYIDIYLKEVSLREGPMRALYVIMGEALGAVPEIREPIASLNSGARARLERIIARGIEAKEFRDDVDASASAALIIGALRGLVMQHLIDPEAIDLAQMQSSMRSTAVGGLT